MKRGFTLIELLVASLLMGMLVTILTMIFNQSSVAWRVGVAGVADLKTARGFIGRTQGQLDDVVLLPNCGDGVFKTVSPWVSGSLTTLRKRTTIKAISSSQGEGAVESSIYGKLQGGDKTLSDMRGALSVGKGGFDTEISYIVNVKSGGPKHDVTDWQAVWSYPDDPSEW